MIKKLSSSDHHCLSPPHFMKRSNISCYEHVGQKLSPQDKLMLSIQSYDNDSKPHYGECPTKMWSITGVERMALLYYRSGMFFLYPLSLLSACHLLIFSFIIHIFQLCLTARACQNLPYMVVEEISYISTSLERMMTLYCNTGLKRRRNSRLLPSAWFHCRKLHQQHNYLYSYRLFEIQSP